MNPAHYYPYPVDQPHHPHLSQPAPIHNTIDVNVLQAGVQRYIPPSYLNIQGVDPATVDFRTFYPYNPSEVKHRKRTTRSQLKILEDTFRHETKPNAALRKQLALQLSMTNRGVQVWFQNRRAKQKNLEKKAQAKSSNFDLDLDGEGDSANDLLEDDDTPPPSHSPAFLKSPVNGTGDSSAPLASLSPPDSNVTPTTPSTSNPASALPVTSQAQAQVRAQESTMPTAKVERGPSPTGLGVSHTSWQSPSRSASLTPLGFEDEQSIVSLRRGSLPVPLTDSNNNDSPMLGLGPPPSLYRMRGGMSALGSHRGSVGWDPTARRASLDRLSLHPYAAYTKRKNEQVFGPGTFVHPSMPQHANMQNYGSRPAMPTISHSPARSEMMHRASMPYPLQTHLSGPQNASSDLYAMSARSYQPPVPGPLPAAGYSFGSHSVSINNSGPASAVEEIGEEESITCTSPSSYALSSRFSSIASVAGSESSATSAFYSGASEFSDYDFVRDGKSSTPQVLPIDDQRRPSTTGHVADMFAHMDMHAASNSAPDLHVPSFGQPAGSNGTPFGNSGSAHNSNYPSPSSTISGGSGGNGGTPGAAVSATTPPNGYTSRPTSAGNLANQSSHSTEDFRYSVQHYGAQQGQSQSTTNLGGHDDAKYYPHINTNVAPVHGGNVHHSNSSNASLSMMYPFSASSASSSSNSSLVLPMQPHPSLASLSQEHLHVQQQSHIPHLSLDIPREKFEVDNGIDFVSDTGHYSPIAPTVTLSPFDESPPVLAGAGLDLDAPHLTGSNTAHQVQQMYLSDAQRQAQQQQYHHHQRQDGPFVNDDGEVIELHHVMEKSLDSGSSFQMGLDMGQNFTASMQQATSTQYSFFQ